MKVFELQRTLWVPRPRAEVFDFFARAENLERITPPWLRFQIDTAQPIELRKGARIAYSLRLRGIPIRWLTEIERWDPPHEFVDVQLKGPYTLWRHTHRFAESEGGTWITDHVQYALPFGIAGRLVHRWHVAGELTMIFDYRAEQVKSLFG